MTAAGMLVAFSVQVTLVTGVACLSAVVLRMRAPDGLLAHYRIALAVALAAPITSLIWHPAPVAGLSAPAMFVVDVAQNATGQASPWLVPVAWSLFVAATLLRLAWFARSCWRLRVLRTSGRTLQPRPSFIQDLEHAIGIRATWVVTPSVRGPATYGWRRPIVLLPEAALADTETARMFCCHELVHIERRDWLAVMVEETVAAVLWFHPAVWLLLDRIHLYREQVVDKATVARTGAATDYALALLEGAALRASVESRVSPAWLGARHLRARILAVTEGATMSTSRMRVSLASMVLMLTLAGVWSARAFPLNAAAAQDADDRIYEPGDGVTLPKAITKVQPKYTPEAMAAKVQGVLLMSVVVRRDGTVSDVNVIQSLDQTYGLDESGVEAVGQWIFEPATVDGKPVSVRVEITMNFTLK